MFSTPTIKIDSSINTVDYIIFRMIQFWIEYI